MMRLRLRWPIVTKPADRWIVHDDGCHQIWAEHGGLIAHCYSGDDVFALVENHNHYLDPSTTPCRTQAIAEQIAQEHNR